MENNKVILICDKDYGLMNEWQTILEEKDYDVYTIDAAAELIAQCIRIKPNLVLVNPDMPGFDVNDVCKNIIQDMDIAVVLLMEPHSATPTIIGACEPSDALTMPIKTGDLLNIIEKHITIHQ